MVHPSFQLNPGDMFQVDVEKVMYGTGVQKPAQGNKRLRENLEARKKKAELAYQNALKRDGKKAAAATATAGEGMEGTEETSASEEVQSLSPEEQWRLNNNALKLLLKDVRSILKNSSKAFTAREKKQLRLFKADAKRFLAHPETSQAGAGQLINELQKQMEGHELLGEKLGKLKLADDQATDGQRATSDANTTTTQSTFTTTTTGEVGEVKSKGKAQGKAVEHNRKREIEKGLAGLSSAQTNKAKQIMGDAVLSKEEMRELGELLRRDEENPVDDSKPYATPWRPRPYMSAFAFIPRYLEVNPKICAAVYLRHPVARKGMAEVPTPFSYLTNQLTHNWYLERG